jgi:DHA1 family tetracycline resistance protein-like MFS transporter
LILGLVAGAIGFAIYGLAPTGPIFWIGLPIMALWGFASPAAQGLMTRRVSASEQGQLQGAIGSIMGITGIIGPTLFGRTFAVSIDPVYRLNLPGMAFVLAALLLAAAAVIAWRTATAAKAADIPAQ